MNERMNENSAWINSCFEELHEALKRWPLPTEDGGTRIAAGWEFMLMNGFRLWEARKLNGTLAFKHRNTRNYIYFDQQRREIVIPEGEHPWRRGTFDY